MLKSCLLASNPVTRKTLPADISPGQLARFSMALSSKQVSRDLNAVKHFKYTPRCKRRIHQKPNMGEIRACRWWLDREIKMIKQINCVAWNNRILRPDPAPTAVGGRAWQNGFALGRTNTVRYCSPLLSPSYPGPQGKESGDRKVSQRYPECENTDTGDIDGWLMPEAVEDRMLDCSARGCRHSGNRRVAEL